MKVQRSESRGSPGYPSKKQLLKHGALLGAAAISLAGGCRTKGKIPAETFTTGGVILAEPPPQIPHLPEPYTTGGVPAYEPANEPQTISYVVQKGDTLYGLAKRFLGNGSRWREIVAANPGLSADKLTAGKTILIPGKPQAP